jgi:hypothetical protein
VLGPEHQLIEVNGNRLIVGADKPVTMEIIEKGGGSTGGTKYQEKAEATTAGLSTSSDQVAQNFKSEAPRTALGGEDKGGGGGGGSGGGFDYSGKLSGVPGLNIYHLLGAAGLVVAVAFFIITKRVGTSLTIAACSLGMIGVGVTVDRYPMVWGVAVALVLVAGGAWLFLAWKNGKRVADLKATTGSLSEAFTHVVRGVDDLDPSTKSAVKHSIEKAARDKNGVVREVVSKIKAGTITTPK